MCKTKLRRSDVTSQLCGPQLAITWVMVAILGLMINNCNTKTFSIDHTEMRRS